MLAIVDGWILGFSAVTVVVTIWMGFRSAKTSKTASDFFVAGRSVSVGWNASAISGEYLSAASFMGIAGMVMSSGYDALWYPVCYACGYLFLLLFIAGPLRRFGAYTIPDFAEGRYDSPLFRKIAVCFVLFIGFFYTMPQMKGAGTTLAYIFPGLPYWAGVVLVGAVITLNVALGGMKGITLVQAFQYWAKMFAISVPIFVLMAVYGHYGKQLGANGNVQRPTTNVQLSTNAANTVLNVERFSLPEKSKAANGSIAVSTSMTLPVVDGWVTIEPPGSIAQIEQRLKELAGKGQSWRNVGDAKLVSVLMELSEHEGRRVIAHTNLNLVRMLGNMTVDQTNRLGAAAQLRSFLVGKEVCLLETRAGDVIAVQKSQEAGYRAALDAESGFGTLRKALPEKAPKDETWLSPFGPLTTKAAKAANALPRWNLSLENREALKDFSGNPSQGSLATMLEKTGSLFDGLGSTNKPPKPPPTSQFEDWTNMKPGTSIGLPGGFPMLGTLREYGLLVGRSVMVATNLPRPKLILSGSFQSRPQFLEYLESLFLTNGVRLSLEGDQIKALAVSDWETYQKTPDKISFVPNRFFGTRVNADIKALAYQYGRISDNKNDPDNINVLFSTNFPVMAVDFNPNYELLLVHEARPRMEKYLVERGVTLIPVSSKEVWAVPTADLARYQLPPVNVRAMSLLYTYSLIIALICGTAGLPHILVRFYTNPDGGAAKRTTMWVMILIGIFYVFPPVFGVMGRNLFPELYSGIGAKGTDKIVLELPRLLNEKYAPLGSILSGITCAGAFAAFMSTFSGLLVSMTGALAHDVYGRMLRPKSTPEQRMRMFKFAAVLIGFVSILLGSLVEPLEINFMVGQAFAIAAASYFPLLFMSVWWRGMTMRGAAVGMLTGGLCALVAATLTNVSNLALDKGPMGKIFSGFAGMNDFWAQHPLLRILCEQPAIWTVPLAITLMIVVSKATRKDVPADVRMKMLVLHAPEKLGLKQEYIQEHQGGGH
jgi:Na+(H+)/acetate symporter ActP